MRQFTVSSSCSGVLTLALVTFCVLLSVHHLLVHYCGTWSFPVANQLKRAAAPRRPSADGKIPKLLHYVFQTEEVFSNYSPLIGSCLLLNPDWKVYLWRDADARRLIRKHYPSFAQLFDNYTADIKKSDVARYFILHHVGGIYIDMDVECVRPFYPQLAEFAAFVDRERPDQTAIVWERHLSAMNSAMGSVPGHPFFRFIIDRMLRGAAELETAYEATGPGMLTRAYGIWSESAPEDVTLLGWDYFSGFVEPAEHFRGVCRERFKDLALTNLSESRRAQLQNAVSYAPCQRLDQANWRRESVTANTVAFHRFMHLGYAENRGNKWGTFNLTERFRGIHYYSD